jgi:hypothetical protein
LTLDFTELEKTETEVRVAIRAVASAANGTLFPLDFLAWASANRTLGLLSAFRQLLEASNYSTAAALVRLQLDTLLRWKAAWHVSNPHDMALDVLSGTPLRSLCDRDGNRLTDQNLVQLTVDEAPWIERVYRETSGFVHLSEKHIFTCVDAMPPDDRSIQMKVSATDPETLTDTVRQEAVDGFVAIVRLLTRYLLGWAATKEHGGNTQPDT